MRRNSVQTADLAINILKKVREANGISRVQVARILGLAPSTTGIHVERLIAGGYLTETDVKLRGAGRPPRLLQMNPDGGEFIGVDFEARSIMAVAVDFSDKPLRNARRSIEPGDTENQIIKKIEEAIVEILPKGKAQLLAIGVGVPGLVDSSKGMALLYKYIAQWKNVPLASRLFARFAVPVFLENNARSMALAEMWFGQGKGCRDFLCVGIRSGIGVGIVMDGRLHRGATFGAGELGRWRSAEFPHRGYEFTSAVADEGPGGPELQEIASARAIQYAVQAAVTSGKKTVLSRAQPVSLQAIIQAAQQRDTLTLGIVAQAATYLGAAIGNLALVLNPAKVMLAGPLTSLGEAFLKPLRAEVARRLAPSGLAVPEIANSTMGEFSGALGAAALALHEWKPGAQASSPGKRRQAKARRPA